MQQAIRSHQHPLGFLHYQVIIVLLVLLVSLDAHCDRVDSLRILISNHTDTSRVNILNQLSAEYYSQAAYDSSIKYAGQALLLAEQYEYTKGLSAAYQNLGEAYYELELFEKSIDNYSKSIEQKKLMDDKKGIAYCLHVIAILYRKMNNLDKAIIFEFQSLDIAEKINDQQRIAYVSNGIAIIYHTLRQYDKALQYYSKLLDIATTLRNKTDIADAHNNIGTVYKEQNRLDKALVSYNKALALYGETQDKKGLARIYSNIGNVFIARNQLDSALVYQERGLQMEIALNNREGIAYSYSNIGDLHHRMGDYAKAIVAKKVALSFTLENDLRQRIYDEIAQSFILMGNSKEALDYHRLSLDFKDTIYRNETKNIIAEIQTKYETEKKEREIQLLTKEREVQLLRLKKNQLLLYSVLGILLLILSLVFVILNAYRAKIRANHLLVQKNNEILNQKEEIEAQRDEIEMQRDMLARQKKNITDSILYAQKIQQAVLPTPEMLQMYLPEHFILFRPRDIVSGDFYWLKRIGDLVILAVADCTGHGVPGAFMSMLGVSFLNEIVNDKDVTTPGEVLNRMRTMVKDSLGQKGVMGEQKDGMDIALCVLDTNSLQLQFAAAYNPIYIIRKGLGYNEFEFLEDVKVEQSDTHTLYEIRGNRQPVAISHKERDFTTHRLQLRQGDALYLFSDGYQDQLGGENNQKFKSQQLKKILLESVDMPMSQQQKVLEEAHLAWRRDTEQIDDILLVGVRL